MSRQERGARLAAAAAAAMVVGVVLAALLWPHLALPFSNPLEVVGILAEAHFNPNNNTLRYLVFIGTPALVFLALYALIPAVRAAVAAPAAAAAAPDRRGFESRAARRLFWVALGLAGLAAASELYRFWIQDFVPTPLDVFHEGECLSPAFNWLQSHGLWTATYFLHGAFFNVMTSVWAWKLFGVTSIGATRVASSALLQLTEAATLGLIAVLAVAGAREAGASERAARRVRFALMVALGVLIYSVSIERLQTLDRRDLATVLGSALAVLAFGARFRWAAFASGLFSAVIYFQAIDRGAFYLASLLAGGAGLGLLAALDRTRRRDLARLAAWLGAGLVAGWAFFYLAVGGVEFAEFLRSSSIIYRTKDYFDSTIYPAPFAGGQDLVYTLTPLLIALEVLGLAAYGLRAAALKSRDPELGLLPVHVFLVAITVCYFRSGIGRSDIPHVRYASSFAYVGLAFLAWRLVHGLGSARARALTATTVCLVAAVALVHRVTHWPLSQARGAGARLEKLVHAPDAAFYPSVEARVFPRLIELFKDEPCFFSLTSEAALPYLVKKPTCGRYHVVWFANSKLTRPELREQFERSRPRRLLFHSSAWTNSPDGFTTEKRLPELVAQIKRDYRQLESIDGWLVYERRSAGSAREK